MWMRTQWRMSMAGATGLDYCALDECWTRLHIRRRRDRDRIFRDLQVMEAAALAQMHDKD